MHARSTLALIKPGSTFPPETLDILYRRVSDGLPIAIDLRVVCVLAAEAERLFVQVPDSPSHPHPTVGVRPPALRADTDLPSLAVSTPLRSPTPRRWRRAGAFRWANIGLVLRYVYLLVPDPVDYDVVKLLAL